MIFYLRNKENKTLFEAEVWVKTEYEPNNLEYSFVELSPTINITNYSNLLLSNPKKQNKIISDFDNLSELRGWLWERFFMTEKNTPIQIDNVINKLQVILSKVARDYELNLITD
jgi:hypothetical protein|tara:strand:+ start:639 stop:980 length:342 start_codon:yes stop_codon:yes gene_type:complete